MARLTVTVIFLFFTLALSVAENVTPLSAEPDPDSTNPTLPGSDEVTVPLNFVNFHPINRHFPRRPLTTTTTSFNRRPCHHHRHEIWGRGLQISYGNDMIFSGEEKKQTGTDRLSDAVVVDIPAIKILVPSEEDDDGSKKITVKLVKRKEGEDKREYYKDMFTTTKIRKFLNHLV